MTLDKFASGIREGVKRNADALKRGALAVSGKTGEIARKSVGRLKKAFKRAA